MTSVHKSVLLHESIDILEISTGETFVDGTIGGGGHSIEVCKRHGSAVRIVGIDIDKDAIDRVHQRLDELSCDFSLHCGNFRDIREILQSGHDAKADAILLDLGWSSDQFETLGRGFSFKRDEPLLMTLGDPASYSFTARDLINLLDQKKIETILKNYGEERSARRIAEAIVKARSVEPIETSRQLAEIIERTIPRKGKKHPATKTFQALRIAVNNELETLEEGIRNSFEALNPNGRLAVISFHSLEDRLVKQMFRSYSENDQVSLLTKKPLRPRREEVAINPRSRSARLRAIKKLAKA